MNIKINDNTIVVVLIIAVTMMAIVAMLVSTQN